ncbi:hypothetical protein CHLRE_13g580000v5 [Chlamydomonas reinhardtii]|uniref:Uncharacterized protein n=1 Tax=Chlamydomonas reinhardtii TaxID=3055 RepID=A0A2K3D0F2_CHLRE|nr:uncharacterized protein CHLRE_13g580000v5 [Chlamydomonas reinhardtii]XP_042917520.1 uncharacterized protein CHLRE_13g580000v5 [Chlamydomonas reinhardtii]PNW73969.1 hypothetical protein CHLRE_13g580000v5 [Chlamydomonas reinhardtii]PNW73970.1 hypothetical protein CHLRE_13g580000v5 [Chlamydomonas reinhardtii]
MGVAALAFCTWAVSLAGLASVQEQCTPDWSDMIGVRVNGFSTGLACYTFFRYYWFIVSLEFALIVGVAGVLATGAYAKFRNSFLGLICVATLLYIQMSDATLTLDSLTAESGGQLKNRVRTWIAGSIMTAAVNCFLIIALGMTEAQVEAISGEKATAV